ncbi:MAG TPA: NlpC/P60 family protein [Polyangiales bacterium]|nr:NlpC/P60 family protein [Polyangiales bacterium]
MAWPWARWFSWTKSPRSTRLGVVICLLFACGTERAHSVERSQAAASGGTCRGHVPATLPLAGVKPEETTLQYWLARYPAAELDRPLLSDADIAAYNARVGRRQGDNDYSQRDLRVPQSQLELTTELHERLSHQRAELDSGQLVALDGRPLSAEQISEFSSSKVALAPAIMRVVLEPVLLRCGPFAAGMFRPEKPAPQAAYDHNACGPLAAQEPVELLGRAANGMWLLRTRYSLGFLPADAALSGPLPAAWSEAFLGSARVIAEPGTSLHTAQGGKVIPLLARTALALASDGTPVIATQQGFVRVQKDPALTPQARPLTRRAMLTAAFSKLGQPYGLGGAQGGLDCSGLLVDVFESFDIALPRFSGWQAKSGSFGVDLASLSPDEKLKRIDLAAKDGVVLLHFPGHIMLYLGRSQAGEPRVLHALGDYLVPCTGGEDTVDVQRVIVSGLNLGAHTSRTSFLERASRMVVFGPPPPAALAKEADPGPPAPPRAPTHKDACRDSEEHRLFVSPLDPQPGEALRAISASQSDPGGASLRIFDDKGDALPIAEITLGGPPYGHVARAQLPAGSYSIVLGRGDQTLACRRIKVRKTPKPANGHQEGDAYWEPRSNWSRATEALYSLFVEQLFAGPPDDEQTWTNLHSLLRDPERNLLLNHLQLGEDKKLQIEPDCADLPYSLRAYFAWKLRLPYGYRLCNRGGRERPPSCGEVHTPLEPRKAAEEVAAFSEFVNRGVRWGVHSATGRTAPDDSESDLYPVALERAALTPGTVYADPYGHVMLISKWFAQGSIPNSPYGVMIAAEAQPDGTIGRRRFWQGSFLFDPDTKAYGAGFKRFRPFDFDKKAKRLTPVDNAGLSKQRELPRFSRAQYEITREDFYERMDKLINPQPLTPNDHLQNLVAALDESSRRRVLSVNNGEDFKRSHPGQVISMPRGYEIFETQGAWEDFATPSRDMRLLIAIDTINALPVRVEKKPELFALPAGTSGGAAAKSLRAALERELRARTFQYTRSDGSAQTLTLADVVARADALEVAYNPNDCVELRWGAPAGSDEIKTCKQKAPEDQRQLLESYRSWFHARTRPPRGK